jgi:signal transduction histidine kinase
MTESSPGIVPRNWRDKRILPAIILCLLAWLTTVAVKYDYEIALPESRIDVSQLLFNKSTDRHNAPASNFGTQVELPYVWREVGHATDKNEATGWYTAVIKLNVPPNRLWVVYFPNITANSTIYLNGEILGRGVKLNNLLGQMRQRPLYLNIPNGILRADENILQLYMESGDEFFGSIEPFHLGPEESFKDVYTQQYFFKVMVVKLIGGLLFFAALATGAIWLLRQTESLYGWFALTCLLWSINILTEFLVDLTYPMGLFKLLFRYSSIAFFCAMLVIVVNRYRNTRAARIEWLLVCIAAALSIATVLLPEQYKQAMSNYGIGAFALLLISYSFFALLKNYLQTRTTTDCLVAYSVAVIFFFSIGDLQAAISTTAEKYSGMTAHFGAPFFVMVLGWKLIKDFVTARSHAEELNLNLERRVAEKTRELEESFARMQALEKRQILAQERDRLIMDMHDGLGGQLVSAMSMLEYDNIDRDTVSSAIKDALEDMRLMIDALDPVSDDLAMVLGSFRQRLQKTLQGTTIKLNWQVQDVPLMEDLGPHKTLQILRILQEAVTNAIKYSGASMITIATGTEDDRAYLMVSDDGQGMQDSCGKGRGLDNMQRRADALNARLSIDNSSSGVSLKLVL